MLRNICATNIEVFETEFDICAEIKKVFYLTYFIHVLSLLN